MADHISYSELKTWNNCPYQHKLSYIDNLRKDTQSIHTIAGTSIHKVCEMLMKGEITGDLVEITKTIFKQNYDSSNIEKNEEEYNEFEGQLCAIIVQYLDALKQYFGNDFTFVQAEDALYEDISNVNVKSSNITKFKGYIDLVLKTADGKVHIIDNKLCGWGWDAKKKTDPMITYQLTFYKYYYAKKYGINPDMIETHFALLKRTVKQDNIEIFKVTSGDRKTENAFSLLGRAISCMDKKVYMKNRLGCKFCEFYKKECT